MILDSLSYFCEKQAVTVTGYSTNMGSAGTGYIDLGETDAFDLNTNTGTEKFGVGEPIELEVLVTTALSDAASPHAAGAALVLETADDTAFSSNKTTVLTIGTFTAGAAPAGTKFTHRLPISPDYRRYLRVAWTVGSGPFSVGKISAYLLKDSQQNHIYPSRITVD